MENSAVQITEHSGIFDWVTPKGVITTPSFIFRALAGVFILIAPIAALLFIEAFVNELTVPNDFIIVFSVLNVFCFLLGLWIILVSVTKHYRTKGMPASFFFALITPVMPFMLVVTWIFASKEKRFQNEHLAKQQAALRKMARKKRKAKSIDDSREPRYVGQPKKTHTVSQTRTEVRDNDAPTVVRRRR